MNKNVLIPSPCAIHSAEWKNTGRGLQRRQFSWLFLKVFLCLHRTQSISLSQEMEVLVCYLRILHLCSQQGASSQERHCFVGKVQTAAVMSAMNSNSFVGSQGHLQRRNKWSGHALQKICVALDMSQNTRGAL